MKKPRPLTSELSSHGIKALISGAATAVLAVAFVITAGSITERADVSGSKTASPPADRDTAVQGTSTQRDPFATLDLEASAVLVKDLATDTVLYSRNARSSLPMASIAKVMAGVTAAEALPDYTSVPITRKALMTDGDNGLHGQEQWQLDTLLDVGLVSSSNDAIAAIAARAGEAMSNAEAFDERVDVFVQAMNRTAQSIGMESTRFRNPHGLDTNDHVSGAYSSARDIARLMEYALDKHPSLLSPTRRSSLTVSSQSDHTHTLENTNEVLSEIPGVIASKTGFTDLAGGNLAVVFNAGIDHPVVAVVLGSSYDGRFSDMLQLVDASIESLQ